MNRLPWWLRPWGRVRTLEATVRHTDKLLASRNLEIDKLTFAVTGLRERNEELTSRNAELARQLQNTTAPAGSGRALIGYEQGGGAKPDFVLVGIDRGAAGGKRLYASRDLGAPSFGIEDFRSQSTFRLTTFMAKMLTIDKPTYGEALAHLMVIWQNWDNEKTAAKVRQVSAGPPQIRTVQRKPEIEP